MNKIPVNLPKSLDAYGQSNFDVVLEDELAEVVNEEPLNELLQDICREGLAPTDGADYEFRVVTHITYGEDDFFRIDCDFNEQIQSGSCQDITHSERVTGELVVGIDRQTRRIYLVDDFEWPSNKGNLSLPL